MDLTPGDRGLEPAGSTWSTRPRLRAGVLIERRVGWIRRVLDVPVNRAELVLFLAMTAPADRLPGDRPKDCTGYRAGGFPAGQALAVKNGLLIERSLGALHELAQELATAALMHPGGQVWGQANRDTCRLAVLAPFAGVALTVLGVLID